jgi:predicted nucleic acid-binding protein
MIAIDSSVLLDLMGDNERANAAEDTLRQAMARGPVVVCDVVVSEVVAGLGHGSIVIDALEESGIGFSPLAFRAAVRAGEMQRRYHERLRTNPALGKPTRTVPDFLIGAHALMQCEGLITHDAGFFRDYFKGLKVIVPSA